MDLVIDHRSFLSFIYYSLVYPDDFESLPYTEQVPVFNISPFWSLNLGPSGLRFRNYQTELLRTVGEF